MSEWRHSVTLDKPTATLSKELAWKVRDSQSRFIEESICWLANYLRKSPDSIEEIKSLTGISDLETSTLTVRFARRGERELGFLTKCLKCSANGIIRAAIRICAHFVESPRVDLLQEQILERNLKRYLSDLRRAGFRTMDISYPLIDNMSAKGIFYLLCREPFALVKGSTRLSIIGMPVGNEVALWKTSDDGTQKIDLMLSDIVGDFTEFSHLSDSMMVARLKEGWQAMGKLRGWHINPQFGPRERRLMEKGVRFMPLPPNAMSHLFGDMREVVFNLGALTLNAIQRAGTNLGNTIRNQPTFGLISEPIETLSTTDQRRKPAALLICLDPNRRILLDKMTKDNEHAFAEGSALTREIVEVLDRHIANRR